MLVNDGSSDETPLVIEAARRRATCAFTVVDQANAGLARGRNAGIARATGERIVFIDDDVLPTPSFVAEHLRSHDRHPGAVVRGAVINTESFERLPTPTWTPANYSGNWFWTTNVSAPLDDDPRDTGGFRRRPSASTVGKISSSDCDCARCGVRGVVQTVSPLAFHYKPHPKSDER